jgi:hypothetical protein
LFKELFRAGLQINTPLYQLRRGATLDDLLALSAQVWIDDLCALSRMAVLWGVKTRVGIAGNSDLQAERDFWHPTGSARDAAEWHGAALRARVGGRRRRGIVGEEWPVAKWLDVLAATVGALVEVGNL